MTKALTLAHPCPCCETPMRPVVLGCPACSTKLEAPLEMNEFQNLSGDELHFLRVLIQAEGRIRDMEGPLSLSYPTIRNRVSELKAKLDQTAREMAGATAPKSPALRPQIKEETDQQILERLQDGSLTYEEALQKIKRSRT